MPERIIKVNNKGIKRRRLKCRKGFKLSADGSKCEPMSGADKVAIKKRIRKSVRTKKSKGEGYSRKINRKRNRAMKKRNSMGLNK